MKDYSSRSCCPDDLPDLVLKDFADILVAPMANIFNTSFSECRVRRAWKLADISPLPKAPTVSDFNKDFAGQSL